MHQICNVCMTYYSGKCFICTFSKYLLASHAKYVWKNYGNEMKREFDSSKYPLYDILYIKCILKKYYYYLSAWQTSTLSTGSDPHVPQPSLIRIFAVCTSYIKVTHQRNVIVGICWYQILFIFAGVPIGPPSLNAGWVVPHWEQSARVKKLVWP